MKNYRKKPVVIQAMQLSESNFDAICDFMGTTPFLVPNKRREETQDWSLPGYEAIEIPTLEGTMRADIGDYIIKGVKGEFYPCKPDIFEQTYDEV